MREILFRGKDKYSEKWAEGDLNQLKFYGEILCCNIIPYEDDLHSHEVIPETVGQYTGLTDKYNRKIFEGDIVFFDGKYGKIVFNAHHGEYELDTDSEDFPMCFHEEFEVRGNIHDDPELLEGGEG